MNDIQSFITSFAVEGFPHLYDSDGEIWSSYGIASQPAWVFVDATGNPQRVIGALGKTALEEKVERLLTG